jgi:hypothetical protein
MFDLWYSKNLSKKSIQFKRMSKKCKDLPASSISSVEPGQFQKDYKDLMCLVRKIDLDIDTVINIEVHFLYNIKIFLICFEKLLRKIIMIKRKEEYRSIVGVKSKEELLLERMANFQLKTAKPFFPTQPIVLKCKHGDLIVKEDCECDYCNPEEWSQLNLDSFKRPSEIPFAGGASGTAGSYKIKHVSFKTENTVHELSDRDSESRFVFREIKSRKDMNKNSKHFLQSFFGYDSTDLYSWDLAEDDMFFS